jgi:GDP-L-fucose synthase
VKADAKIFVAGSTGLVGSAVVRRLKQIGRYTLFTPTRKDLNLENQADTHGWLARNNPDVVIVAAALVGGIGANMAYPASFIHKNLSIAMNIIHGSFCAGVDRLIFLGSSCIYPKLAPQPMSEEHLLTGPLEPTNEAYAVAKIAGLKLCQYYRKQYGVLFHSLMPTNLYGPGDNYHPENSHVLPGLIRRFHEAKEKGAPEVVVWGSGTPRREFLYVDDLASAVAFTLNIQDPPDILNVGCGYDVSIQEAAELVAETVGYRGRVVFDKSKPDGTPRKLLDVMRLRRLGWCASIPLSVGIQRTYASFIEELATGTLRR